MIPLEKTYTVHLPFKTPTATLVIAKNPDEGYYNVAVATCHSNDQFSKKLGRQIAFGRLNTRADIVGKPKDLFKYLNDYYYLVLNRKDASLRRLHIELSSRRFQFFADLKTVFDTLDVRMKGK